MKKLMIVVCLAVIVLSSLSSNAQNVTITVDPGWTWISYPRADTMDVTTALRSIPPSEGDIIKSQTVVSQFIDGQWVGSFQQFIPGKGCMYKSMKTYSVDFVFGAAENNPEGALGKGFSVSATQSVYFSKGNLQYIGSATQPYWKFADHQWDYLGDNGQGSVSQYVDRDLFGWGTSGYNHGATCYQPWSTSENNSDYNIYGGYYYNLFDQTGQADWGYNAISNGGNQENQWRTLSYSEWNYLLNTRNTMSGIRFAMARVNNVNGVILLPDNWNESIYNLNNTNQHVSNFDGNIITASEWNILEVAGAVFMPAGGTRFGTSVGQVGIESTYWTSTRGSESGACGLLIEDGFIATGYTFRSSGYAVRLVCNIPAILPEVSTLVPSNITSTTATVGGNVFDNGGAEITESGVCWSTEQNPTIEGNHIIAEGVTLGEFMIELTDLIPNTIYYVRAYAVSNQGVAYGEEVNFTTLDENGGDTYEYVDLCLPSGTLWATCNVGADAPEGYGDYFAWGETETKDIYEWSTYQHCNGSSTTLTKYCNNYNYGYEGFIDGLTVLLPEDDAVTTIWGANWRMPTKDEWMELYNNTTVIWITRNGVNGRLFVGSNGNSLFLPAAGRHLGSTAHEVGVSGHYWASSLGTQAITGYSFGISSDNYNMFTTLRYAGHCVRAVRSSIQNNAPIGAINGEFTIDENGNRVYFSQGNLQYQASTDTWRFAENQWDLVVTPDDMNSNNGWSYYADVTSQYTSTSDAWIDLFGWATSGYNHGSSFYQPWSTASTYNYYAYGSYRYNLFDQTGQADWGYNAISNGGNQPNQWRTLNKNEWHYVLNLRNTPSGIRYAKAQVNGVNGIILFPDDWYTSIYSPSDANTYNSAFSSNEITNSVWSILELHGAVFLPAAGYRYASSVYNVGDVGDYWSSSYCDNVSAYFVQFNESHVMSQNDEPRNYGYSVRLARTVEE